MLSRKELLREQVELKREIRKYERLIKESTIDFPSDEEIENGGDYPMNKPQDSNMNEYGYTFDTPDGEFMIGDVFKLNNKVVDSDLRKYINTPLVLTWVDFDGYVDPEPKLSFMTYDGTYFPKSLYSYEVDYFDTLSLDDYSDILI